MASLIVGGMEELRKRPIFSNYRESVSPLYFTVPNENVITSAKASIPIVLGLSLYLKMLGEKWGR